MDAEKVLEKILADYVRDYKSSNVIKAINRKIEKGIYRYSEAEMLAQESGRILEDAFRKYLPEALTDGKLYRATAEVVLKNPMLQSSRDVRDTALRIQRGLNEQAGIGIQAIAPEVNEDQIDGIITGICNANSFSEREETLYDQVTNFLEGTVDDCVRENADFQYRAGLSPKIERRAVGKCCAWCSRLAGIYEYADVRDNGNDVFRRHKNCHCIVSYNPGDGSKRRQNVYTKIWTDEGKTDRIRLSETVSRTESKHPEQKILESEMKTQVNRSQNTLSQAIRDNPKVLASYTPETMKAALENAGFHLEPLSKGRLKDVAYENGGGYKVTFGGDGILAYHPEKGSHHDGAYWKVSGGGKETERYDMGGNKIK